MKHLYMKPFVMQNKLGNIRGKLAKIRLCRGRKIFIYCSGSGQVTQRRLNSSEAFKTPLIGKPNTRVNELWLATEIQL